MQVNFGFQRKLLRPLIAIVSWQEGQKEPARCLVSFCFDEDDLMTMTVGWILTTEQLGKMVGCGLYQRLCCSKCGNEFRPISSMGVEGLLVRWDDRRLDDPAGRMVCLWVEVAVDID